MKQSISYKLFIALTSVIISFVIISFILNTIFLEKFYIKSKEKILLENFNKIEKIYKGNLDDIALELEKLEGSESIHIIIADKNFLSLYNSRFNMNKYKPSERPEFNIRILENMILENIDKFNKIPIVEKRYDRNLGSSFLTLYGSFDFNEEPVYIMIRTSVLAIKDSADIANKFFVFTALVVLILGAFIIYIISKKITRPILDINETAKEMCVLNFNRKIEINSVDELGELSMSINLLSIKLEESITELKEANLKLQQDIKEKEKIDKLRKEFISNVSHELKTPIALILGYTEGLKVNINEGDKDFYCDVITDEAVKMNRLVMSLLEIAQLESGFINIEKLKFDIGELVENNIAKNSIILKEKDIDIKIDINEKYFVRGDYYRIEQVLNNYLSNAINHVNEKKIIKISIKRDKDKIRISVFNSGAHIKPDNINKVWESFYKIDKARTREYGGTGLGLYVVKTIMEAHKEPYGVSNAEGGVEFWFELEEDKS